MKAAVQLARDLLALDAATRKCGLCHAPTDAYERCHAKQYEKLIAQAKRILKQAGNAPN